MKAIVAIKLTVLGVLIVWASRWLEGRDLLGKDYQEAIGAFWPEKK
jgi:hypothetical protein